MAAFCLYKLPSGFLDLQMKFSVLHVSCLLEQYKDRKKFHYLQIFNGKFSIVLKFANPLLHNPILCIGFAVLKSRKRMSLPSGIG